MKISTKLKLMSAGVMATLAIFSSLFFITNNKTSDIISHVTKTTIPSIQLINEIKSNQLTMAVGLLKHILSSDPILMQQHESDVYLAKKQIISKIEIFSKLDIGDSDKKLLVEEKELLNNYFSLVPKLFTASSANNKADAMQAAVEMAAYREKLNEVIDSHIQLVNAEAKEDSVSAEHFIENSFYITLSIMLVMSILLN